MNRKNGLTSEENSERLKILKYAQDYYLREGFYKTSMDTLAAELRVSKKTIYKYFPSKETLVEEVINELMHRIQLLITEIVTGKYDAVHKIKLLHETLGHNLIKFSDKWLNDLRVHAPHLWKNVDEFRTRKLNQILSGIFDQGKKEGLFEDKPNEILVTLFTASLRAIVSPDFLYFNKFSYSEAVSLTFDILFNGLLTNEGAKTYKRKLKEKKNEKAN
jgi:AcrR family transcriptional regulator